MRFHHHHHGGRFANMQQSLPTLPPATEASAELEILDAAKVHLRREDGRLQMMQTGEGEEWIDITLVRLFPMTMPDSWISLLNQEGNEIGVLRELRGLSQDDLALIEDELRRRYLVPQIDRIVAVKPRFDMMEWTVETDRGRRTFLTRNLRDTVQRPSATHITMLDVEGNRYDIVDIDELDAQSRKRLNEQL